MIIFTVKTVKSICSYLTMEISVLLLLLLNLNDVSPFPILDIELTRLKSMTNGITTIIRYVDLPKSLFETYVLSCKIPTADRFEWEITTRMGSPHPSSMKVNIEFDPKKPWERVVNKIFYVFIFLLKFDQYWAFL